MNKILSRTSLCILLSLPFAGVGGGFNASAQTAYQSVVKGTDGHPVSGAIITVKGGASAVTDEYGKFSIEIENTVKTKPVTVWNKKDNRYYTVEKEIEAYRNGIVVVKAPGFYDKEFSIDYLKAKAEQGDFTILLVPRSEKQYSGYVTSTLDGEQSANEKFVTTQSLEQKDFLDKLSVGAAVGNNIAGLQVTEKGGMPNEGAYMSLRGIHSLVAENNPLLVINGVPYFGNQTVSSIIEGYSRDMLAGYATKDIRSITVLKGSEAAKWGSLGSNGVIMIETQQANSDNLDTRISFSGQYGLSTAKKNIPMMNAAQYKSYMQGIGLTLYPGQSAFSADYPFFSANNAYPYLFNENNDWMDQIQCGGFLTDNQLRVEGGDEIAKYNISFGYTKNNGTLKNTTSDRYHTLISADVLVTRNIDIFANVSLSYITSDLQNQGTNYYVNPMTAARWYSPMISAYKKQADGQTLLDFATYNEWNSWNTTPMYAYDNVSNPIALIENVNGKDKIYDANASLGANFRLNDYLTLHGLLNLYYNYTEEDMFVPGQTDHTIVPQYYGKGNNYVAGGVARQLTNTYQVSADYKRTFSKVHEWRFNAFARWLTHKVEVDGASGYNTPNDYFQSLNSLQDGIRTFGGNYHWNYFGTGLYADYTWKKLVRLNAGFNLDGTSASGAESSRMGFFPSVAATLMIANSGRLPEWVNRFNVSLGASYSGNSRFSSNYSKDYYVGTPGISGVKRANMPNPKLQWETTRQIDFGLDLGLLKNRLSIGFNTYYSQSYNLLFNNNISGVYGSAEYFANTGKINNAGVELSLRVNPLHTKDWNLVVGGTLATNSSRLLYTDGRESAILSFTDYSRDDAQILMKVGDTPYQFYGYQTAGVYATTAEAQAAGLTNSAGIAYQAGDMKYVDQNGDGIIDGQDKVAIGKALPDFFGAVNLSLSYKKFTLDANFAYSVGNDAYNYTRRTVESMSTFYNQSTSVLNRWQVEGQQTNIPRAVYGDAIGNSVFSDRWIEDASYLKLRSLRLSYNFGKFLHFINSGTVWVAGENLFTLTKYLGTDPEFAYGYSEAMRGFDYSKLALGRTFKLGFDLNF